MKKILAAAAALALFGMLPAGAKENVLVNGIYYNTDETAKTAEVAHGSDGYYTGDVTIPSAVTIDGVNFTVNAIATKAFDGCTGLSSVVLPKTIKTVGNYAFQSCTALKEFTIPGSMEATGAYTLYKCSGITKITVEEGVKKIDTGAFFLCSSLTDITLPESLEIIESSTFTGDNALKEIRIPDGVKTIGLAFADCRGLETVYIGKGITDLKRQPFDGCSNLKNFIVDPANPAFASVDGVIYSKDLTVVVACPRSRTEFTFPEAVTEVGYHAFDKCSIAKISWNKNLKIIGEAGFRSCSSLENLELPEQLEVLGKYAFIECHGLDSVLIQNKVKEIGASAFNGRYIQKIKCTAMVPPACDQSGFSGKVPRNATLCVPSGTKEAYANASGWKNFTDIVDDLAGINEIDGEEVPVSAVYDLSGRNVNFSEDLDNLPSGIYIVRKGNNVYKIRK